MNRAQLARFPITFWLYVVPLLALINSFILAMLDALKPIDKDAAGMLLIALPIMGPIIAVYLLQCAAIAGFGVLIARGVVKWSTVAIIFAALIAPIMLFIVILPLFAGPDGAVIVGDPRPFYILATLYILVPAVAYNDIKYRKPHYAIGATAK